MARAVEAMNDRFIVFGLPRSRTAWLSTLFTAGPVFCWHDLSGRCESSDSIADKLTMDGVSSCGVSDPGLVLWADQVISKLPGARLAYVRRDPSECAHSLARVTGGTASDCTPIIEEMNEALDEAQAKHGGHVVSFRDLDSEDAMRELWWHLVPLVRFPKAHWLKMRDLNVQIIPQLMRDAARQGPRGMLLARP